MKLLTIDEFKALSVDEQAKYINALGQEHNGCDWLGYNSNTDKYYDIDEADCADTEEQLRECEIDDLYDYLMDVIEWDILELNEAFKI